jgi:hypothetical protein
MCHSMIRALLTGWEEVKPDKSLRKHTLTAASSALIQVPNPTPCQTKIAQMRAHLPVMCHLGP